MLEGIAELQALGKPGAGLSVLAVTTKVEAPKPTIGVMWAAAGSSSRVVTHAARSGAAHRLSRVRSLAMPRAP